MLGSFVGAVDLPAAAVLIAISIAVAVVMTTFLSVHTGKQQRSYDFELAKMTKEMEHQSRETSLKNDLEKDLARVASNREVEIRRIESGLVDLKTVERQRQSDYDNEG